MQIAASAGENDLSACRIRLVVLKGIATADDAVLSVVGQDVCFGRRLYIPQFHGPIGTCTGQRLAVSGKGHGLHDGGVPVECDEVPAGAHIPKFDGRVAARRRKHPAVWEKATETVGAVRPLSVWRDRPLAKSQSLMLASSAEARSLPSGEKATVWMYPVWPSTPAGVGRSACPKY